MRPLSPGRMLLPRPWSYPMGGTIDGQHGDHVLLAPPFIVSESDIDQIVDRLALSIDAALRATA